MTPEQRNDLVNKLSPYGLVDEIERVQLERELLQTRNVNLEQELASTRAELETERGKYICDCKSEVTRLTAELDKERREHDKAENDLRKIAADERESNTHMRHALQRIRDVSDTGMQRGAAYALGSIYTETVAALGTVVSQPSTE